MTKWMIIGVLAAMIAVGGCKGQEEKVQTYDKPSDPMMKGPVGGQQAEPGKANSMQESINSNPNIPDAAKKALGTK